MDFETQNLTKSFGAKQVLKGVGLHAQSGKALGLLGRNGAGKTTTIRIIMGVFPPDSGEVLLEGPSGAVPSISAICRKNTACTPKKSFQNSLFTSASCAA
mgnify:CR=1 FL=1